MGSLPVRDEMPRHRALLLIGDRAHKRLREPVARRVLDRLLQPAAQVEGVDLHLGDPALADAAALAKGFALVLPALGNLSNPYYRVHPRRNDRFVAPRAQLKALFPEVDFAPFTFTGHALATLAATCPDRFVEVRRCLSAIWVQRMQALLAMLPARGVLIDLPAPPWLMRPPIPGEGARRIRVDPDDRGPGAALFHAHLRRL
ncbi:DUF6473 family protein [Pararhodobacter sp.]